MSLALNPNHFGANEYLGYRYFEMTTPDMDKQRLEVLKNACDGICEEYTELKENID